MFGSIGPLEIGIVVLIVVVLFGAKRLPELGSGLGRGMREFKDGITGEGKDNGDVEAISATQATPAPSGERAKSEIAPDHQA
jgi:sec-independent protein translocase protein TatA